MKTNKLITGFYLLGALSTQAAVLIDLDLTTPGIQNSITDATEGQIIEIALVVTGLTATNPCMNGMGGDISSRGSMTVAFDSLVYAGSIANFTNNGFSHTAAPGGFPPNTHINTDDLIGTAGLAPLSGYTNNVGGAGLVDPRNNLNGANELFSFTAVPGSAASYATIFRTSITVSNVNNKSLELFPSGIFDNPATVTMAGEVALNPSLSPPMSPTQFIQEGELTLHTESHDFQSCLGGGIGAIQGASISGVPEPSSAMLAGSFLWILLIGRRRS